MLLYGVSYYSKGQSKSNRELFTLPAEGGSPTQLTKIVGCKYGAIWSVYSKNIFYLAAINEGNGLQIWSMNPDGTSKTQISNVPDGVTNIKVAPNGTQILFTGEVTVEKNVMI